VKPTTRLTIEQYDAIEYADMIERSDGWAIVASDAFPLALIESLVSLGLLKSEGQVEPAEGGEESATVEGWTVTPAARAILTPAPTTAPAAGTGEEPVDCPKCGRVRYYSIGCAFCGDVAPIKPPDGGGGKDDERTE
jgi:hypothetical protein